MVSVYIYLIELTTFLYDELFLLLPQDGSSFSAFETSPERRWNLLNYYHKLQLWENTNVERINSAMRDGNGELMKLVEYMEDVANEMSRQSTAIRRDFSQHRLSAGENRQDLVENFLLSHLPERFGVSSGFVVSHDGMFSNQADLVVVDKKNNAPLYGNNRNKLWPAEAVYALIEVKTKLDAANLTDSVSKGQRFKRMTRKFCETKEFQSLRDSLFVVWSFESSRPKTMKDSLIASLENIPWSERPDFIIALDGIVARSGSYLEISKLGHPNSPFRQSLVSRYGDDLFKLLPEPAEIYNLGPHSLLAWYIWFDSWLRQAGSRFTNPVDYLPKEYIFGTKI